jgi:hypothetical protein
VLLRLEAGVLLRERGVGREERLSQARGKGAPGCLLKGVVGVGDEIVAL